MRADVNMLYRAGLGTVERLQSVTEANEIMTTSTIGVHGRAAVASATHFGKLKEARVQAGLQASVGQAGDIGVEITIYVARAY